MENISENISNEFQKQEFVDTDFSNLNLLSKGFLYLNFQRKCVAHKRVCMRLFWLYSCSSDFISSCLLTVLVYVLSLRLHLSVLLFVFFVCFGQKLRLDDGECYCRLCSNFTKERQYCIMTYDLIMDRSKS